MFNKKLLLVMFIFACASLVIGQALLADAPLLVQAAWASSYTLIPIYPNQMDSRA